VDEIHAFAGDDRGWHLLAVLSRIERLCGREFVEDNRWQIIADVGQALA
jgi:hypothetical protein